MGGRHKFYTNTPSVTSIQEADQQMQSVFKEFEIKFKLEEDKLKHQSLMMKQLVENDIREYGDT